MANIAFLLNELAAISPRSLHRQAVKKGWETKHWEDKANSFCWQEGKEASYGYLLMKWKDVSLLDIDQTVQLKIQVTSSPSDQSPEANSVTLSGLFIKSIKHLYANNISLSDDSIVLIHLVDKRHTFAMSHVMKTYNVPNPAPQEMDDTNANFYDSESLNSGSLWTWQTMIDDLWKLLPGQSAIPAPTLPFSPNGTPYNFQFWGIPAWDAIFKILSKISCSVSLNPILNLFSIFDESLDQGVSSVLNNHSLTRGLANYNPILSNAVHLPAQIKILFPKTPLHYGTLKEIGRTGNHRQTIYHESQLVTGIAGALPGSKWTVFDDFEVRVRPDGTLENGAAAASRAVEVLGDLKAKILRGNVDRRAFFGLVTDVSPGSDIHCVVWSDTVERPGLITQVESQVYHPSGPEPGDLFPQKMNGGIFNVPDNMAYGTQGSNPRSSIPGASNSNYPQFLQLVMVDTGTALGFAVSPTGDGLVEGRVLRANPDTAFDADPYIEDDPCWLAFIDRYVGSNNPDLEVVEGERYLGRLMGSANPGADERPLFLVSRPPNRVWHMTYVGSTWLAGATATSLTLPDGRARDVINWSTDVDISNGDKILVWEDLFDSKFYAIRSKGGSSIDRVWYGNVTESLGIDAGASGDVVLSPPQAVTATFWADEGHAAVNDKIFVWKDPTTELYYFIKAGGDSTLVRFQLTADLVWGAEPVADNARILEFVLGSYQLTDTIRVFDMSRRSFEGLSGASPWGSRGWARLMPDRGVYEVIYMERIANFLMYANTDDALNKGVVNAYFDGVQTGFGVDLNDQYQFFTRSYAFARGFALRNSVFNEYIPILCETFAGMMEFDSPLITGASGSDLTINAMRFVWGSQLDTIDPTKANTVAATLLNTGLYTHVLSNAVGIASYDSDLNRYRPIVIDQKALILLANANQDFTNSDTLVDVDGTNKLTPFPFGGDVGPTSVKNTFGISGSDNDKLLLLFDQTDDKYILFRPGGKQPRRFKGVLDGTLAVGQAATSVTISAALDGGAFPATVTAQNDLGWAGPNGAFCLVTEDLSVVPKEYLLEIVQHYDCLDA
jgi:hypothetical protein